MTEQQQEEQKSKKKKKSKKALEKRATELIGDADKWDNGELGESEAHAKVQDEHTPVTSTAKRIIELEEQVRTLEQKLAHLQTQHKRLLQKSTGKVGNPNNPRAL